MTNLTTQGMVADIQRFSLHDGPGIRTTVFLKGCNLRCAWCHNPETIAFEPQILFNPEKCIHCGKCDEGCYSGARKICGKKRTVSSVLEEVLLDKPYYGVDGGVTISGGEPMCQPEFSIELLQACGKSGIHTALESNMSIPWNVTSKVLKHADMLMCDLKIWNSEKHLQWTGAPNERIKDNIKKASNMGLPVLLRTPIIPSINDNEDEILNIAQFAKSIPTLICYELLPYHPLGLSKILLEGFEPKRFERPSKEKMNSLGEVASSVGVSIRVAGKQINLGGEDHD